MCWGSLIEAVCGGRQCDSSHLLINQLCEIVTSLMSLSKF